MGVPCSGCGREYDVTLFEFGRTIHCTCGRRVGLEPRVRNLGESGPLRFIADAMLGRLAHWLRILGFDTAYDAHISDADLARRAVSEGRVVLTRDRSWPEEWRVSDVRLLSSETAFDQLREVIRAFDLGRDVRLFTRCSRCNEPLVESPRESVRGRVPERILRTQERFESCPGCQRVYWSGSHTARMRRVVDSLLSDRNPEPTLRGKPDTDQ